MQLIIMMTNIVRKSLVFSIKTMAESSVTHDGDVITLYVVLNWTACGVAVKKVTVVIMIARLVLQSAMVANHSALVQIV